MADTYNSATGKKTPQSLIIQKSVEFTRPANTTAYTIGDIVAPDTKAITAASNATPIVITSVAHGLATGDRVTIASVGGNTNANGDWVVTVLTVDTFSIATEAGVPGAGNSAYTSGGTFQKMLRFADVVLSNGASAYLLALQIFAATATVTLGQFRVRFYNSPISQIVDNAAFTLLYANRAKSLFYIDNTIVTTDGSGSDSAMVDTLMTEPKPFVCDANRADLFIQITALAAYVPTSAETFRVVAQFKRDQPQSVRFS